MHSDFSGWIDPPEGRQPPLEGELRCDVAVVGGGYTGMAATLRLAERGLDVVLLEASFCGWGASVRGSRRRPSPLGRLSGWAGRSTGWRTG